MILHGDSLLILPALPAESVDAVVTDPPYELGFMGRGWDASGIAYSVAMWREVLRVLKPGGHLLAFGGTRTYHRMACAIEDAGFEIRDSIHWIYGSGFPKSLDVSKAIDKAAGAEREVVGTKLGLPGYSLTDGKGGLYGDGFGANGTGAAECAITAPATDAAKQWSGWGTALKPAHEPIVVARKPLIGTVADNVQEYGTGALNIDGCRVGVSGGTAKRTFPNEDSHVAYGNGLNGNCAIQRDIGAGRWPPNILLSHAPACVPAGTRKVKTGVAVRKNGASGFSGGLYEGGNLGAGPNASYASADGTETIEAWECAKDCPVAEIDRQSGIQRRVLPRNGGFRNANAKKGNVDFKQGARATLPVVRGDSGGASRFFPVFRYQAKASRSERGADNKHPTVKPVALMEWLLTLVVPPGGTVLDPFTGSGTTGVAAARKGLRFIGIEREAEYVKVARVRIERASAASGTVAPQGELFAEDGA